MPRFNRRPLNRHHCLDRQVPLSTEILHVTKISGLRGAPVDRVEVCYKVSHSFCTSAILLVYQAMRAAVLYRKTPSGVPAGAVRLFCTGKRPLVYQAMPCCRFVMQNALWCTKRCRTADLYRKTPSGVPSDAVLPFCTGKRPMVYQQVPCGRFVQENALWRTKRCRAAVLYRNVVCGVPA